MRERRPRVALVRNGRLLPVSLGHFCPPSALAGPLGQVGLPTCSQPDRDSPAVRPPLTFPHPRFFQMFKGPDKDIEFIYTAPSSAICGVSLDVGGKKEYLIAGVCAGADANALRDLSGLCVPAPGAGRRGRGLPRRNKVNREETKSTNSHRKFKVRRHTEVRTFALGS